MDTFSSAFAVERVCILENNNFICLFFCDPFFGSDEDKDNEDVDEDDESEESEESEEDEYSDKEPTVPCNPPFESVSFAEETKLMDEDDEDDEDKDRVSMGSGCFAKNNPSKGGLLRGTVGSLFVFVFVCMRLRKQHLMCACCCRGIVMNVLAICVVVY